jgi:hypothetical protein
VPFYIWLLLRGLRLVLMLLFSATLPLIMHPPPLPPPSPNDGETIFGDEGKWALCEAAAAAAG